MIPLSIGLADSQELHLGYSGLQKLIVPDRSLNSSLRYGFAAS